MACGSDPCATSRRVPQHVCPLKSPSRPPRSRISSPARGPVPTFGAASPRRPSASDCLTSAAPSLACVAARAATPQIQQTLAPRIEPEEAEDGAPLSVIQWLSAAHELVIRHAPVSHHHGAPRPHRCACPTWQARTKHNRIERIALPSNVPWRRAVVERAGQRRDEVDAPAGRTLDKAASRDLDHNFDLRRLLLSIRRFAARSGMTRATRPVSVHVLDRAACALPA